MAEAAFAQSVTRMLVWDVDTLAYIPMQQPVIDTDTINVSMAGVATQTTLSAVNANTAKVGLTPASGSVSSLGNNALVTPSAGKKLRLSYVSANPALAVELGFRCGTGGTLFLRNSLSAGAVVAKDFGDMRYLEGGVDEPLYLNLSVGVATIWNALYIEV